MRTAASVVLIVAVAFFFVGCGGGSDKDKFVKDSNKTLDSLEKDIKSASDSAGTLDVAKKAKIAAAETVLKTAREAVKKVESADEAKFEEVKKSAEAALNKAKEAVEGLK